MTLTDQQIIGLSRRDAAPWAERVQALAAAQVERQLPLLGELAEMGLEVARAIERAARAWTPPKDQGQDQTPDRDPAPVRAAERPEADPEESGAAVDETLPRLDQPPERHAGIEGIALAYARVSRSVRLSIALQSKLLKDLEAGRLAADERERETAKEAAAAADRERIRRRDAVADVVLRVAYAETPDQEAAEEFYVDAHGWLKTDRYGDLIGRPMSELVAQVCKDLDLTPDWDVLAEDVWAQAEIASGSPGAPLKIFLTPAPSDAAAEPGRRRAELHNASP